VFGEGGIQAVRTWLSPLLKPYIIEAYTRIRTQHGLKVGSTVGPVVSASSAEHTSTPHTSTISMASETIVATTLSEDLADVAPAGYLQLFNQHTKQRNIIVEWTHDMSYGPAQDGASLNSPGAVPTPIWTARAVVGMKAIGQGVGRTKKIAKEVAARRALQALGVEV
jgi:ribonuclease III